MEIALLLGLILLNGIFAMSEIALVTSRKPRLQRLAEEGDVAAAAALKLAADPTRLLSTVQIGITSIGILNGIVGEAALAGPFAVWLQSMGVDKEVSEIGATALVVIIITYVSIVLGELIPKRLAQITPEPIARLVAAPMLSLAALTQPFVRLLSVSTELVLRLVGTRSLALNTVTQEDIQAMLTEGSHAGVIEQHEHEMVVKVFLLDERHMNSLMIPRSDIVYLDVEDSLDDNLRKLEAAQHTRYPVCRGGMEQVIGVASAKQLLAQNLRGQQFDLTGALDPPLYVPETLTGAELLDNFRSTNRQFALVLDEYGVVQGLVTLRDVLEAITGEFTPQRAEDAWATRRDDGSWLLDGLIPLHELRDRIGLRKLPEESGARYNTLSGMLMLLLGRVPGTGDIVEWDNWRFEAVDMDNMRVDKVIASRIPEATARRD